MKSVFLICLVLGLGLLGLYVADKLLPYGFGDSRRFAAMSFASAVRSNALGGTNSLASLYATNAHRRVFPFYTNVQLGETVYHTEIGLYDGNFRRKGFLASTTNAEMLWIDPKGSVELVQLSRR